MRGAQLKLSTTVISVLVVFLIGAQARILGRGCAKVIFHFRTEFGPALKIFAIRFGFLFPVRN